MILVNFKIIYSVLFEYKIKKEIEYIKQINALSEYNIRLIYFFGSDSSFNVLGFLHCTIMEVSFLDYYALELG